MPATPSPEAQDLDPAPRAARPSGEAQVLWVIWMTYGSFYFCRQNISAALPGLQLDDVQKGFLLGSFKIAYAVGQLINGQLAERIPARKLLAIGMLASAGLNVVFGLSTGLYFLIFVWACNGYCQSLGWTPCIRVLANWIPADRRGRVIGIIGTCYQVMTAVTYIAAGFFAEWYGWRWAMFMPAMLLAASAIHTFFTLEERPPDDLRHKRIEAVVVRSHWSSDILLTLKNPALWVLAVTLALVDACRYGFADWGITHLLEVQPSMRIGKAGLQYAILPAGGIAGALFSGWTTDRFFAGRRAPVICGLLLLLGFLSLQYDRMAQSGELLGIGVLLFGIGFCIFGSQVLLVGTAPSDMARKGTAAAAAGFVNAMGSLGSFCGDQVTGYLKKYYDWQTAIRCWAIWAFVGAGVIVLLWRYRPHPHHVEVVPGPEEKL